MKIIKAELKKYFVLAFQNDGSSVLIVSLLLMILLTLLASSAITNSIIEVKISANFKRSNDAFYIAEAGIELAKIYSKSVSNDSLLQGDDGLTGYPDLNADNGILFYTNPDCVQGDCPFPANSAGSFKVVATDNDEDADGVLCPGDDVSNGGDDDCWVDTDGQIILTSTGTTASGTTVQIEIVAGSFPFMDLPGAISFIDNDNGDTDDDRIRLGANGSFGDVGTSADVAGAIITGLDTFDDSPTVGDVPGTSTDKPAIATQELFETTSGGVVKDVDALDEFGINEVTGNMCSPSPLDQDCLYAILSGSGVEPYVSGATDGPTESEVKSQVKTLFGRKDIFIDTNNFPNGGNPRNNFLSAHPGIDYNTNSDGYYHFGTAENPKITFFENGFDFDENTKGYGIMILDDTFSISGTTRFEFHGIIYVTCGGQFEMVSDNSIMEVWGAILMVNYAESVVSLADGHNKSCSGNSDEERFELKKGITHIYWSTQAIETFAEPLSYSSYAWRQRQVS